MKGALAAAVLYGSATALTAPPEIQLCPGLTIVTAVSQSFGDYESIKTIESVTADEIRLKYSSETPYEDGLTGESGVAKTLVRRRTQPRHSGADAMPVTVSASTRHTRSKAR